MLSRFSGAVRTNAAVLRTIRADSLAKALPKVGLRLEVRGLLWPDLARLASTLQISVGLREQYSGICRAAVVDINYREEVAAVHVP